MNGGISFVGLLTVLFVTLKLCGVIQWSWLWVLSPIWIGVILFVAMVVIAALAYEMLNSR